MPEWPGTPVDKTAWPGTPVGKEDAAPVVGGAADLAKGAGRGFLGFIGTMADAVTGGQVIGAVKAAGMPGGKAPTKEEYLQALPKTTGERLTEATGLEGQPTYTGTAGEFLGNPASYLGAGGLPFKAATAVGASVGAETGRRIGGLPGELLGALAGGELTRGGIAATASRLTSAKDVTGKAVETIQRRFAQDEKAGGSSATDALQQVNDAAAAGKPLTLADVGGKNVQRLAGSVYRQGGEGAAGMEKFLGERDLAARGRLDQDIAQYVHGGDTMHQTTKQLLTQRSADARPLWRQVEQLEGIWSPDLQKFFLENPDVRKGMGVGYRIERNLAAAEKREFDPTKMGVDLDAEGNISLTKVPNMRVLHMGKVGLDAMIAAERDPITGKLSQNGFALDQLRRSYLRELDTLDKSGIYRRARAAWEGPSASLDAVREGRSIFQMSPEEVSESFAQLSPSNQEFFRTGVADILRERVGKAGITAPEFKKMTEPGSWARAQLRPIFRSEDEYNKFINAVTQERTMFGTPRRVGALGKSSQTAEFQAEDSQAMEHLTDAAHIGKQAIHGNWLGAALAAFQKWRDLGLRPDPRVTNEVAKILFQTPIDPASEVGQRLTGTFQQAPRTPKIPSIASTALRSELPAAAALSAYGP